MAESPYLVALALAEQEGRRILPLTGKSRSAALLPADPGEEGTTLALELLLRLWQRSDEGPLRRAAGEASLLLVELPLEGMSEQLPILKANWIRSGDTAAFQEHLATLVSRAWRISIARYEPVSFIAWP
ncbi:MAG TPA: hypothetical protein VER57_02675 [Cyanobium sp.]|nr:hypothetical protein [Cyanobium sp.]